MAQQYLFLLVLRMQVAMYYTASIQRDFTPTASTMRFSSWTLLLF